ncbi:hypothetical protein E2C01_083793 [Portunus trituberculatus]|uniref:Uncharacterized protein n=1 Tax=Portunus trituberculatus TaxID=210409 RepID=A0A5B7IW42_PORTR|nr:hypothetical protein [Portunus trituberculatus]
MRYSATPGEEEGGKGTAGWRKMGRVQNVYVSPENNKSASYHMQNNDPITTGILGAVQTESALYVGS